MSQPANSPFQIVLHSLLTILQRARICLEKADRGIFSRWMPSCSWCRSVVAVDQKRYEFVAAVDLISTLSFQQPIVLDCQRRNTLGGTEFANEAGNVTALCEGYVVVMKAVAGSECGTTMRR
jgi:hypothetical protein